MNRRLDFLNSGLLTIGKTKGWLDLLSSGIKELSLSGHTHNYAATSHTHTKSQITDFPTSMTPTSHTHVISDITDMPSISNMTHISYCRSESTTITVSFYPVFCILASNYWCGFSIRTHGVIWIFTLSGTTVDASTMTATWTDNSITANRLNNSYVVILGT